MVLEISSEIDSEVEYELYVNSVAIGKIPLDSAFESKLLFEVNCTEEKIEVDLVPLFRGRRTFATALWCGIKSVLSHLLFIIFVVLSTWGGEHHEMPKFSKSACIYCKTKFVLFKVESPKILIVFKRINKQNKKIFWGIPSIEFPQNNIETHVYPAFNRKQLRREFMQILGLYFCIFLPFFLVLILLLISAVQNHTSITVPVTVIICSPIVFLLLTLNDIKTYIRYVRYFKANQRCQEDGFPAA